MKSKSIGKIAFWKYDLYPYTLYGKIISTETMRWGGRIWYNIENYGSIAPFLILDEKRANKIIKKLKELENNKKSSIDYLNIYYDCSLKQLIPDHPIFK